MEIRTPRSLAEALELKAERPDALAIQGGTDVMVALNFDRLRPEVVLNLSEVAELRGWSQENGSLRLGAGLTYSEAMGGPVAEQLPALAEAARTVGSPQIRNRGTIGGNLATASPAGDALPPLLIEGAEVECASVRGRRRVALADFVTGVKRTVLAPDELITAVLVVPSGRPQTFLKIGPRNAMVIAVCSLALALHPDRRRVGTGIGSAGPVPLTAPEAERFLEGILSEHRLWEAPRPLGDTVRARFGDLIASAAQPVGDVRGTAAYRVQALRVVAGRVLDWVWADYLKAGPR